MSKIAQQLNIWAEMPLILALARSGSLQAAADHLALDRTTIGRRLRALEHALGGRLFEKGKGRFVITAFGREVLTAAEAAEQDLAAIQALLPGEKSGQQAVPLTISTAPHLMPILAPAIMGLYAEKPSKIDVRTSYALADLEAREADLALRLLKVDPAFPLVGRKLRTLRGAMYRSKTCDSPSAPYIERDFDADIPDFAKSYIQGRATIRSGSTGSLIELIASGGVGRLPLFVGDNDPRLVRCSDILPSEGWQLWLVSHVAFSQSPRVKDAIEILSRSIMAMKNI